jgi:hypothetical protein
VDRMILVPSTSALAAVLCQETSTLKYWCQAGANRTEPVLNQDEVLSCLILADRWKFGVLGILSVLRFNRGETLNQRAVGSPPSLPSYRNG